MPQASTLRSRSTSKNWISVVICIELRHIIGAFGAFMPKINLSRCILNRKVPLTLYRPISIDIFQNSIYYSSQLTSVSYKSTPDEPCTLEEATETRFMMSLSCNIAY